MDVLILASCIFHLDDSLNMQRNIGFTGTSLAAKALRESGVTLFKVRDETVKLLGQSDIYIFSPEYPPLTKPARKALEWAVDEKLKSGILSICICLGYIKAW